MLGMYYLALGLTLMAFFLTPSTALPLGPDGADLETQCRSKPQMLKNKVCQDLLVHLATHEGRKNDELCSLLCAMGIAPDTCNCERVTSLIPDENFNTTAMPETNTTTQTKGETTTLTDICKELCEQGEGGSACVCENQPPAIKSNEDICRDLCEQGQGGSVCVCENQPPAVRSNKDICRELCDQGMGGSVCVCENQPPARQSADEPCNHLCETDQGGALCPC